MHAFAVVAPTDVLNSKAMSWVAASGARLGERYVLDAKIGEGGMGEVWRGKHLALENEVAIKLLSGSLANNDETKQRFLMEAKLTAQLRSRHAVQVFDFGLTDDDQPYLVMELLRGEPLSERIDRLRGLSFAETASVLSSAAKALQRAHALGIVHRDFKPDNIFLTKNEEQEDEVKVVDFGIAKLIGSLDEARPSATDFAEVAKKSLSTLTRTGKLIGTPHYMSPEQVRMSADVGPATDIWAFGIVAFETLTGQTPFEGDDIVTLFANIQLGKARKASELNPNVPPAFEDWFKIACASDPLLRFPDPQTAATLLADALGVALPSRALAADPTNLMMSAASSSPDLTTAAGTRTVSSTDALSRTAKHTMTSTAADLPTGVPKKSKAVLYALAGSLVIALAIAGVAYKNSSTPSLPQLPTNAVAAVTTTPPTSTPPVVEPTAPTEAPVASAAPVESVAAAPAISPKPANPGKVHASTKNNGRGASSSSATTHAQPPIAQASAKPPASTPTASSPSSPFSLPPLGL